MKEKFEIQEKQYAFPYHYLVFLEDGVPHTKRSLGWGIDYLTYMTILKEEIENLEFDSILDIGCGDGYLLNHLNTEARKIGVDLSEKAVQFARAFSNGADFAVEDIFNITDRYGLVSLIEVLEHIPDELVEKFMMHALSLVEDEGFFVISVPTTSVPLNRKHYRHYDEDLLSRHVESFAELKLLKEIRAYRTGGVLKFVLKLLNNRIFSINSRYILRKFWQWHRRNNFYADSSTGAHLIRIYQKQQISKD